MKRTTNKLKPTEGSALHDALIDMGFAFMEGSHTYLFEYIDDVNHECHVILDSHSTVDFKAAIDSLGMGTFNRYLTVFQRKIHHQLSQQLMKKGVAFTSPKSVFAKEG